MAITRPKHRATGNSIDAFIGAAPDSKPRGVMRGRKQQISLTVDPALLAMIDALATRLSLSRAAVITMALNRAVDEGLASAGVERIT